MSPTDSKGIDSASGLNRNTNLFIEPTDENNDNQVDSESVPGPENENQSDEEESDEEDSDDTETEDEDELSGESENENESAECSSVDPIKEPLSPNSQPTCYICLNEFEGQDVGSPDSCENIHHFCLECIEEWSKQVNTCPVDRKTFTYILVKRELNGEITMKLPVTKNSVVEIEMMDDDVTYCEICGRCDREDRLLLCDGCDFGYHCECLDPPLETVPVDDWFCPECFDRRQQANIPQTSSRRAIARTGAFEIVRNRILARRTTQEPRTRTQNSNPPRRKARRKRRKTRKTRKTTKSSTKKGKKTKTRRRRKRTRKSKLSYKRLPSASVRSRIASKLGITRKPKSPFGLPAMKLSSTTISEIRSAAGIGSLSIFGNELDFNNPRSYDDEFEFESSFGGVGLIARARNNLSGPVGKSIKSPFSTSCMNSADLLSEIMNSQEILHATSCDLSVARDGRIYLKSDGKNGFQKCADSNSSSSSSPSSSNDNNGSADNSNNNNGYLKQTSYSEQASSNSPESDISLIKPSPVVALLDEKADFELYSDIESVGDNREETEDAADKKISVKCKDKVICDKDEKHDNISGENIEAAETPIDSSNNHKSNDSIDSKAKRRPSIRDLFGGDSDEEVDDDLKQLVAQQGSINIHYPIKMPIVLKTNFINDKFQSEGGNEVPISKKWIPIYPEAEKCKNTGPKWKAVGQSNLDKANNDSKTNNQKQIEQINKTKEKNDNLKFETIKNDNVNSLNATKKPEIQIEKKDYFRSVEESQRSKEIIDIVTHENAKVKKCIEDSEKKIRVCKHGRLIKKDKPKEIIKETMKETRKRSQSFDREQNKKSNANPNILNEDKDKHLKKLKLSQTDDNDANLNWKKLSSSSKMRNYRDGKYKDVDLLYKDRLLKSDPRPSKDKKSSHRDGEKRKVRTEKMDRDHHSRRKFEDESRNRRKSSSKKSKHKSSSKIESEPKTKDNKISNRRASTEKEIKSSKGTKHHNHHHHHHSKHKHSEEDHHHKHHRHHNPSKSSQVDKLSGKIDLVDNSKKESLLAKSSNYETYPVLKTLDSKQIYSEGDKIIINVNFKRDKTPNEDGRINLKRDIKEFNLSQNKDSFNNSHHDSSDNNVDILSPQSIENYAFQSDNSISSPFSIEEFADTNRSTVNKISENFKKVLSEEFNFLPRILSTKETSNSNDLGPTTPDQYLDDSFLPTPTQDESHSPIINTTSNAIISRLNKKPSKSDSILSTSPLETNDFYDPELPLQSPDRDSIKSPSKDKDKIIYDSVASPKESPIAKRDNSLSHGNSSAASTSLSSTVAAATATLASLNSINLAQLIQIAQTLKMKTNSSSTNKNSQNNQSQSLHMDNSNRDIMEIVDMDVDSPTPCSSPVNNTRPNNNGPSSLNNVKDIWDQIVKTASARLNNNGSSNANQQAIDSKKAKFDHLLEEPPTSAVDMEIKDKYIKKLNRLERVVEEVKVSLKPHYQKKKISKDEYKEILRKAVPKICHNKSGEINPLKISKLVEGYIKKYRYLRKKTKN